MSPALRTFHMHAPGKHVHTFGALAEGREVWCLQRLVESMNNANLDVIVYPTWTNPPRLIGDFFSPDGEQGSPLVPFTHPQHSSHITLL